MFNRSHERKATKSELDEAELVYGQMTERGHTVVYAGGKRSKGHGFWVDGQGFKSIEACCLMMIDEDFG